MQALTVAVSQSGIDYFAKQLVIGNLVKALDGVKPADRDMSLPNFSTYGFGWSASYSKIKIYLTNASLTGFLAHYQSITQQQGGKFLLLLKADNFTVNYNWRETYYRFFCASTPAQAPAPAPKGCSGQNYDKKFDYRPKIGTLSTSVSVGFVYNAATNTYDVKALGSSGTPSNVAPNIPANSVVQNEDQKCFSSQVSDATAASISSIDFSAPIAAVIPPLLRSIPASGNLTEDIRYEFALGDSGLTFPNDNGLAVGVTGRVSYKGEFYPATPPPPLPVPPVPGGANHVHVYVSDYELNALHWAYFKAGRLNTLVRPADLPDPDALMVETYVSWIPAFEPYSPYAMWAQVNPNQPPVAVFQQVYIFTRAAMARLQTQLPSDVYKLIGSREGRAYVSKEDLELDLAKLKVPATWFGAIADATRSTGMAVSQDLNFTLTIQDGEAQQPNLVFDLVRTDILQDLALGISGTAQTMQYSFKKVKYKATFVSTTVPDFDTDDFGSRIWPVTGEPRYTATLDAMGKRGVPLPIMEGFQFLFSSASLSIQQGYVSVLSQVQLKSGALERLGLL